MKNAGSRDFDFKSMMCLLCILSSDFVHLAFVYGCENAGAGGKSTESVKRTVHAHIHRPPQKTTRKKNKHYTWTSEKTKSAMG